MISETPTALHQVRAALPDSGLSRSPDDALEGDAELVAGLRQTTRHRPAGAAMLSKVRSKVSGTPNVLASFKQAPPPVMFSTVQ